MTQTGQPALPTPDTETAPASEAAEPAGHADVAVALPQRVWRPLPARAYRVFLIVALIVAVPPAIAATVAILSAPESPDALRWVKLAAVWMLALGLSFWVARRRHRHTFWLLDEDGFAVRRGRMWQWETRVPTSRVQHLDLKRGPVERAHGLASLVLHTAGTRLSAVSISGLEDADAEALRDHFSRQIDRQDDDDVA